MTDELCSQSLPILYEIRDLIGHLIADMESRQDPGDLPEKSVLEDVQRPGSITYRQELVSCGKGCKGCPHGPYWYGYWKEGGKTRSKYIGKNLRPK
jgi:hypothetical protein